MKESEFERFPTLKRYAWPAATNIQSPRSRAHPLQALTSAGGLLAHVADATERAFAFLDDHDPAWLTSKSRVVVEDSDLSNVSAALAEIRAYHDLVLVARDVRPGRGAGADFLVKVGDSSLLVEVHAPQHVTKRRNAGRETLNVARLALTTYASFPFGAPERLGKDNVQGEAVSKLARRKSEEHQFDENSVGVLWLDFQDPSLWVLEFPEHEFLPVSSFREELTSGSMWSAFYGEKGLPVYDALSVHGLLSPVYEMEFDGRFTKASRIDFVISSTRGDHVVFENPVHRNLIDAEIYRAVHLLPRFNLEHSWFDWPLAGSLLARVAATRQLLYAYRTAFQRIE